MKRARMLARLAIVTFAALASAAPMALAQREARPAPEPGPHGHPPPAAAPEATPSVTGPVHPGAAGADAGAPATAPPSSESDGDEGDRATPAPAATTKLSPMQRQPAVLKDGMLRIPGGRFTMGTADKNAPANERPARIVTVSPFWIDRTEVTVAAYRACVDRGACPVPARSSPSCTYDLGDPALPISCVPWSAANAFCLAAGKRLPREVEWESAARGNTALRYPWGSGHGCGVAATMAAESTNRSCSGKRPSRVGAHLGGASPFGVLDMSGNVEEWVADWYADSISELSPRAGASHVLRGGGWLSAPSLSRATTRNWGSVREAGPNVGFRCAKDD